jgi:4-hydroxybenzoate polyprenyltransferase
MSKPTNPKESTERVKRPNSWLKVSKQEFLPANSASLIIGLAWGLTLPIDLFSKLVVPLVLAFAVISFVGAFAAHINTMADYELDQKDDTKKQLVEAMGHIGKSKLKKLMIFELSLSLIFLVILSLIEGKVGFIFMWIAAVFLAYAYSAPPLRFKSRSIVSPITLMIVLSILPVSFVTYVFASMLEWHFVLFLAGQALTVYGVIVPAEIRYYFGDREAGAITMTVNLGLEKASLLELALLSIGGVFCGTAFVLKLVVSSLPTLSVLVVVMVAAYIFVLGKYWKLFNLSRLLGKSKETSSVEQDIVQLAAKNPKWITIVTQAIVFMCIILLIAKLL